MKVNRIIAVSSAVCVMTAGAAFADTISINGTVTVGDTYEVYAPIGGTVYDLDAEVGRVVKADDVIAKLRTDKVYATEAGMITGIFGEPGDAAETVAEHYGAVMYIEGDAKYSVAASTENAYNSTETKYVHVGEQVYLKCRSDSKHKGVGLITNVSGIDYTVEITEGEFLLDESVDVYRSDDYRSATRIGRGNTSRKNPTAVSGSGSIVSIAVHDGDTVQRGDLLFETLPGTFDGLYMSGAEIYAGCSGTISAVNIAQGASVEKNAVLCVIYPSDAMRIEAQINESDLAAVKVGDSVSIELNWNSDDDVNYPGTITRISAVSSDNSSSADLAGDATYTVYIDFTPDTDTRFGMTAVVTTIGEDDEQ